jgi:flagellin-specific chaperone FliS
MTDEQQTKIVSVIFHAQTIVEELQSVLDDLGDLIAEALQA